MTAPHPGTGDCFPSPVPAGSGWPGEPATPDTPVARTPGQVRTGARRSLDLAELDARVSVCRACPRLVDWRERVAVDKRKSWRGEPYWGRPIPGFGAAAARIWILGLAPAAHGANRTGRVFTGDRSGDVLFAALHRAGLVNAARSEHAGDGLAAAVRVLAAVRCAPPDNAPTPAERAACAPWLSAEWRLAGSGVAVVVALGGFAWRAALDLLRDVGIAVPTPMPRFGHLARVRLGPVTLLGCYHPSQQNTFTGRLTPTMLDDVFAAAVAETAADTVDADTVDTDTIDADQAAQAGERTGGSRRCDRDATLGSRPRPGP